MKIVIIVFIVLGSLASIGILFIKKLNIVMRMVLYLITLSLFCILGLLVIKNTSKGVPEKSPMYEESTISEESLFIESSEDTSEHDMIEFSTEMQEYFETWELSQTKVFADLLYNCAKDLAVPIDEVDVADPAWGGEDLRRFSRFSVGDYVADVYIDTDESGKVYGYLELE